MNVSYEFSRVRESFKRVKQDMHALTGKINENYEDFLKKHSHLAKEIDNLTQFVRENIDHVKNHKISENTKQEKKQEIQPCKEILDIKEEIKLLKSEIKEVVDSHHSINKIIDTVVKNKDDISTMKQKLKSSELEIFLLKERLLEKDLALKELKETNLQMLNLIDELSNTELEILNSAQFSGAQKVK